MAEVGRESWEKLPDDLRERLARIARRSEERGREPIDGGTRDGLPECEVVHTQHGPALARSVTISGPGSSLDRVLEKITALEAFLTEGGEQEDVGLAGLGSGGLGRAVFLDLETAGFSSTPLFLAGTMTVEDGGLEVRQFFARDYSQEKGVLQLVSDFLAERAILITFNGKSYDLPFLRERCFYHGVPLQPEPVHLDLLHPARRRWRNQLPNCRLVTLEWHLCGRRRVGDIPGSEIPAVYHDFVRSGTSPTIGRVFHHNVLDLVTLAELLCELVLYEKPPA